MFRFLFTAALFWAAVSCSPKESGEPMNDEQPAAEVVSFGNQVLLKTSLGDLVIELDPGNAPVSVANFLDYLEQGHYDGTVFHRAIDGYLIEGGKLEQKGPKLIEKPTDDPIINESRNGLLNDRGALAMARTARPDSAAAAFFINLSDNIAHNHPLPDGHGYAVFGRVISGMDVADQIGQTKTGVVTLDLIHPATGEIEARSVADVPLDAVTILSATRIAK
jgi:peptidyl-prolyl cis-trans isomerase A (cyclophilin A)